MTRLEEIEHETVVRRRTGLAVTALATVLIVAFGAWYASGLTGSDGTLPTTPGPSTSATQIGSEGQTVGRNLAVPLTFKAPAGWIVQADEAIIWLDSPDGRMHIEVGGPVTKAWNPVKQKARIMQHGLGGWAVNYNDWLRANPSVTLLDDQTVPLGEGEATILTYQVNDDAPIPAGKQAPIFAWADGGWSASPRGEVVSEVALEVSYGPSSLWLIRGAGAQTPAQRAEMQAALDVILGSLSYTR